MSYVSATDPGKAEIIKPDSGIFTTAPGAAIDIWQPQTAANEQSSHTDRADAIGRLARPLGLSYGLTALFLTATAGLVWELTLWAAIAIWLGCFSLPYTVTLVTGWILQLWHTGPGVERLRIKESQKTARYQIDVETAAKERLYLEYLRGLYE